MDIPTKRWEKKPVGFLTDNDVEALLQAPDLTTWLGRRDRTLMALMVHTGLRVSETIGMRFKDVELGQEVAESILIPGSLRRRSQTMVIQ